MKSFGGRRKARIIKVDDPEEPGSPPEAPAKVVEANPPPAPLFANVTKKPFRQSGLRKSINVEEASVDDEQPTRIPGAKTSAAAVGGDDDEGNVVVRPALRRAGSTKQKKRKPTSRLSFGIRAEDDDDDDDASAAAPSGGIPYETATPRKKAEGGGLKKAVALKDLAMRSRAEDDDRPRYSREYLEELQSSTPNTPAPASRGDGEPAVEAEDSEMDLDVAELEGAMIVDSPSLSAQPAAATAATTRILTEAEIREKKERRARLAHESDFISLNDEDDDEDDEVLTRKKKDDTRLVREDENILEGFDDFVEDGDVALGRKAEREARRRRREEMASMIRDAEGNSDEESDESDAERRAAFEAAQSRAGMDGLRLPAQRTQADSKPRVTPLPSMAECLQDLQGSLEAMRVELEGRSKKVAELRREREEIRSREKEVQRLVNEAGEKYRAAAAGAGASAGALEAGGDSPAAAVHMLSKESVGFAAERGLESFGTPTSKNHGLDDDGDVAV